MEAEKAMRVLATVIGTIVGLAGVALYMWVLWKLWFGWGFVAWILFGHYLVFAATGLVNSVFAATIWGATFLGRSRK